MEDQDKTLEFLLEETLCIEQTTHCFFIKVTAIDNKNDICYGRLDVEYGRAEELDDHCDQCFNEKIGWFRFRGDNKLCRKYLMCIVGCKKFNYFKERNELHKILGDTIEIIDTIK